MCGFIISSLGKSRFTNPTHTTDSDHEDIIQTKTHQLIDTVYAWPTPYVGKYKYEIRSRLRISLVHKFWLTTTTAQGQITNGNKKSSHCNICLGEQNTNKHEVILRHGKPHHPSNIMKGSLPLLQLNEAYILLGKNDYVDFGFVIRRLKMFSPLDRPWMCLSHNLLDSCTDGI